MFFVISITEDGDVGVESLDKPSLIARLSQDLWVGYRGCRFHPRVPSRDPNNWFRTSGGAAIIIEGEIVVPRAKEKIVSWELVKESAEKEGS